MSTSGQSCCPGCGARFRLRAEAAGKKVQCKCGQVFVAVLEPVEPAAPAPVTDHDLDEHEEAPAAPASATNPHTPTLPTNLSPVMQALMDREDDTQVSGFRERWLPISLLAGGALFHAWLWYHWLPDLGSALLVGGIALAAQIILFAPIMLFSIILAVKWFDVSIGTLPGEMFKCACLALGPAAIADVLFTATLVMANFDWEIIAAGFGFYLVIFGICAAILFEMGVAETAFVVLVNFIPRVAIAYPVAIVLQNAGWLQ